jgi:long-chain acyl-CoA synthetase
MEKIWLKNYPHGVPYEVNADSFPSILELLEHSFERFADRPCFSNLGVTLTFREVDTYSRQFAAFLQALPHLQKGDRLAIQLPNLLQYPIALFGALRAGMVVVNTNPLYTAPEMEFQFNDSGAKVAVVCANFAHNLQQVLPRTSIQTVVVTEIGDMLPQPKRWIVNTLIRRVKKMVPEYDLPHSVTFREALRRGAAATYRRAAAGPTDLAFIQYTGGTTGVAKGAMLTHRNIVANAEQVSAWMKPTFKEGQEICLAPLPMYHVFTLTVNCLCFFHYGTLNVLITNARDIPSVIKEMKRFRFSLMTGVNTLFNALLNHPDIGSVDFSSLKFSVAGAMALQKAVADRWRAATKTEILEGYGLTETSPVACCNPSDGRNRQGTIGLPLPSTELRLLGEDGKEVGIGEPGEICIRGPQVMRGYWKRDDETAKVLDREGWLRTGDVAELSADGYVKIVDRKKDMIIVSGFKVYPNEVEDVLAGHPKILEAGVVGIDDAKSGQVVKAFVVRRDPSLSVDEVIQYAHQHLTSYKVPKQVEFLNALPKTNVGKVLRRELRS